MALEHFPEKSEYFDFLIDFLDDMPIDCVFNAVTEAFLGLEHSLEQTAMIYIFEVWARYSEEFD
jgi:hypothetical protein